MNAHQRRKESRHRHMALPLGKGVRVTALRGRTVYAYGELSANITIGNEEMSLIASAKVSRHVRCGRGGLVDLTLISHDGKEQRISTSARGIRLVDQGDRSQRPWWADLRRRAKVGTA